MSRSISPSSPPPNPADPAEPRRRRVPWLAGGLALALLWALGASGILLFHDDVLARFVARQAAMRGAYEARISELQEQMDRGRTDRAGTEVALAARVSAALERQAELERRQTVLAGLAEPAVTGTLSAPAGQPAALDGFSLRPAEAAPRPSPALGRRSAREAETGLIRLEARLEGLGAAQGERLERLAARADAEVARLRGVIGRTGLDPARFDVPAAADGLGGPLVPLDGRALAGADFDGALALARRALGDGRRLRRLAAELPLRRPTRGEAPVSSPFGSRLDPFTRGLALHTGLDLKAEYGAPARATAAGVVTAAERSGGYGNMVEIDHGHGLTTRFGHLARIGVRPGQRVAAGETIGLVGSTGRSTGAHLHYETRIDGDPVDPQRFLDAGRSLDTAEAEPE
ncbi:M23 family metallopeptidase [Methylobacterium sp. NEAU 140]|uniref:M23 family metallopeptidase n=1 Tax=Methylobacterium sp. NEAU 140 TaxID=3064945 RepID=UPI0027325515|nr:M23 family metallopeptidase [Methylobacterium sp. NEAU 140]MDP4024233.1 M23 family metallopeptidase [Methylobacterium sp. NEAU 140]